jgi:hypothetical protein
MIRNMHPALGLQLCDNALRLRVRSSLCGTPLVAFKRWAAAV